MDRQRRLETDRARAGEHASIERFRSARRKRALIVLVLSTLVACAIAELAFRGLYGTPVPERLPLMEVRANPTRGFEMIPNTEHYTYCEHVRVDNLGLRGADVFDKEQGELRILALGDSMVFGQGVAEEDTLPVQLERALAPSSGRRVRVINAGIRAYNTAQEIALLEELGPRIQPDIVVLFWFANDLENPNLDELYQRLRRSGPILFDLGAPASGRALFEWRVKQLLRTSAVIMKLHHEWNDVTYTPERPEEIEKGFAELDRSLDSLQRFARDSNGRALIVLIPVANALNAPAEPTSLTLRVQVIAARHALGVVDLFEVVQSFARFERRLPVIAYDGHYDGAANAVMARRVARELCERFPERLLAVK